MLRRFALALMVACVGMVVPSMASAREPTRVCENETIRKAAIEGNLTVVGECTMEETQVNGTVTVTNADLHTESVKMQALKVVGGFVESGYSLSAPKFTASDHSYLHLKGYVGGNLKVKDTKVQLDGDESCGAITGNLIMLRGAMETNWCGEVDGNLVARDARFELNSVGGSEIKIGGKLSITGGETLLAGVRVGGNVLIRHDSAVGYNHETKLVIAGNTIGGKLACFDDEPLPTDEFENRIQPNSAAKLEGECAAL